MLGLGAWCTGLRFGSNSASTRTTGSQCSHYGRYQFQSPISSIDDGTSTRRTIVASMKMANGEAEAEQLEVAVLAEDERAEDADHDRRRGGDHAAGRGETVGDGLRVVAGAVVLLADAGQQEDLVVHREAEDDGEQHHRRPGLDRALRGRGR